jgi:hypothetical protein
MLLLNFLAISTVDLKCIDHKLKAQRARSGYIVTLDMAYCSTLASTQGLAKPCQSLLVFNAHLYCTQCTKCQTSKKYFRSRRWTWSGGRLLTPSSSTDRHFCQEGSCQCQMEGFKWTKIKIKFLCMGAFFLVTLLFTNWFTFICYRKN